MLGVIDTAGERLAIDCALDWVADLVAEGSGGELRPGADEHASVAVCVEKSRQPFLTAGWQPLARGSWQRRGVVVVENACTAGFDMHAAYDDGRATLTFRWRPPIRDRAAAQVLRSRFHLLARAVLMQYPALWRAGIRGRAPLHASACRLGAATPMLTATSGIGRSTLLLDELRSGAGCTGDNLAVGDGVTLWGLVEPVRVEGGSGRAMPHGRRELPLAHREAALTPDSLIALERGDGEQPVLKPCSAQQAVRALVTSTYMAGELRRYWPFAATLSAGTGAGPSHPPVTEVAEAFAASMPRFTLSLAGATGTRPLALIDPVEVAA